MTHLRYGPALMARLDELQSALAAVVAGECEVVGVPAIGAISLRRRGREHFVRFQQDAVQ